MCRRCGEPDRRGSAADRRARKAYLLDQFGDGRQCPCIWCGITLTWATLQQDRLVPGGPYSKANVVPSCGPCNIARNFWNIPDGCEYGPVGNLTALGRGMTAATARAVAYAGERDTSLGSRPDASREVLTDTSHRARVDVSTRSLHDASTVAVHDGSTARLCAWCHRPIPATARRDAVTCSKRCRQARHRFTRAVGRGVAADVPLRLAYADPPYPGLAERYYRDHPDYGGEVDHAELIGRLSTYDGWALSTSASALPAVLALCPPTVRVAAWVRGERPTRSGRPLNAWEPVIYHGGRHIDPSPVSPRQLDPSSLEERQARPSRHAGTTRRLDVLVHHARPRRTDPARVIGAKPAAFARWMFDLLGARPGDQIDDLFLGSGGITRAWHTYTTSTLNLLDREDQPV